MRLEGNQLNDALNGSRFKTRTSARKTFWLLARAAVTIAAFAYLFSIVEFDRLIAAFSRISAIAAISAIGLISLEYIIGAWRWRALLAAYGAAHLPASSRLLRLHLVGAFFNTYLPGGLGGDVVRGIATRNAFNREGATGSLAVVLVERIAGVSGLLILSGAAFVLHPLPGVKGFALWGSLGLLAAFGSVLGLALGRRFSRWLPGPIGKIAASLPEIKMAAPFVAALALSVVIQFASALIGHVLVNSIAGRVALANSIVVVPMAIAAGFFPFTVAGAGAREAAFVALYGVVGVSNADALAGSLAVLFCQLSVAATGGLLNLFAPLNEEQKP